MLSAYIFSALVYFTLIRYSASAFFKNQFNRNIINMSQTILENPVKKETGELKIRNIAIIAHVDHGKTTLVDSMFKQSGLFRDNEAVEDRIMDSGDLERERGITISAKNCEVLWNDVKINILDTPGHADFSGEVERALSMVDGVVLLVDAAEGPLPQTRFVLSKTLENNLDIVILINKIDRDDARPDEVYDEVLDLLIDLGADEKYLESPVIYANGRDGIAKYNLEDESDNLDPLMDTIINHVSSPDSDPHRSFQMVVADLDYSDYLGRMAIGKIESGSVSINDRLIRIGKENQTNQLKISRIQVYKGTELEAVEKAEAGDIVILSGVNDITIGDTISTPENTVPLPRLSIDDPTVSMRFTPNTSPQAGTEGTFIQGAKLFERLKKETLRNVSLQIEAAPDGEGYIVKGRGEFQMAILIETMRREGLEFCVGRPHVIYKKDENGRKLEPIEHLVVDVETAFSGVISETLLKRKAQMVNFTNTDAGRVILEYSIPSRSLIGYRDKFMTDTKGTGIMNSYLEGYEAYRGDYPTRNNGSLIADRPGDAVAYAIFNLEPRGKMYIVPGNRVYEGMVVGEHNRETDLNVNPTKTKQLSNMRASGKDVAVVLTPVIPLTPEAALNIIDEDELVEVTPVSIRLRKRVLGAAERKQLDKRGQTA